MYTFVPDVWLGLFVFILGKLLNILGCKDLNNQVNWSSGMILA